MSDPSPRPSHRGFLPALEGLRTIASVGIIVTHVAFQTGEDVGGLFQRVLGRFDFFVAVFFALSGFLLWRSHGRWQGWAMAQTYYLKRVARIMPAYWVCVGVVLLFFPVAFGTDAKAWLANLFLLQVYVPDVLSGGLTHLWSLSVEVSFYLAMPLIAWALSPIVGVRARIATISAVAAASLGWALLPLPLPDGLNPHILPPAFFSWFAVGMVLAEIEAAGPQQFRALRRLGRWRFLWFTIALAGLVAAAMIGPEGLVRAPDGHFAARTLCGMLFAVGIIAPYALAPQSRWLEHPVMQMLGRWSYGIFLWHVAVLSVVFPLLGVPMFSSSLWDTLVGFVATAALSIPVAAASFALVEEPARKRMGAWIRSRGGAATSSKATARAAKSSVGQSNPA